MLSWMITSVMLRPSFLGAYRTAARTRRAAVECSDAGYLGVAVVELPLGHVLRLSIDDSEVAADRLHDRRAADEEPDAHAGLVFGLDGGPGIQLLVPGEYVGAVRAVVRAEELQQASALSCSGER